MSRTEEARRYRRAAELTLDQLEACVHYLRSIRKGTIADRVEQNRNMIRRLLRENDGPDSSR